MLRKFANNFPKTLAQNFHICAMIKKIQIPFSLWKKIRKKIFPRYKVSTKLYRNWYQWNLFFQGNCSCEKWDSLRILRNTGKHEQWSGEKKFFSYDSKSSKCIFRRQKVWRKKKKETCPNVVFLFSVPFVIYIYVSRIKNFFHINMKQQNNERNFWQRKQKLGCAAACAYLKERGSWKFAPGEMLRK